MAEQAESVSELSTGDCMLQISSSRTQEIFCSAYHQEPSSSHELDYSGGCPAGVRLRQTFSFSNPQLKSLQTCSQTGFYLPCSMGAPVTGTSSRQFPDKKRLLKVVVGAFWPGCWFHTAPWSCPATCFSNLFNAQPSPLHFLSFTQSRALVLSAISTFQSTRFSPVSWGLFLAASERQGVTWMLE